MENFGTQVTKYFQRFTKYRQSTKPDIGFWYHTPWDWIFKNADRFPQIDKKKFKSILTNIFH